MPSLSLYSLLYFTMWVTLQRLLYARSDHVPYVSRFMLIHHDPFFPIRGLGRMRGIIFGRYLIDTSFFATVGVFIYEVYVYSDGGL